MCAEEGTKTSDPADMLDRGKCLQLLAELRHAKWFQVYITPHSYLIHNNTPSRTLRLSNKPSLSLPHCQQKLTMR